MPFVFLFTAVRGLQNAFKMQVTPLLIRFINTALQLPMDGVISPIVVDVVEDGARSIFFEKKVPKSNLVFTLQLIKGGDLPLGDNPASYLRMEIFIMFTKVNHTSEHNKCEVT